MNSENVLIRKLLKDSKPSRSSLGYPKKVQKRVGATMARWRSDGESVLAVAKRTGLSQDTVRRWSAEFNPKPRAHVEKPVAKLPQYNEREFAREFARVCAHIDYVVQGVALGVHTKEEAFDRIASLVNGK